jgi:hypothetical protein
MNWHLIPSHGNSKEIHVLKIEQNKAGQRWNLCCTSNAATSSHLSCIKYDVVWELSSVASACKCRCLSLFDGLNFVLI